MSRLTIHGVLIFGLVACGNTPEVATECDSDTDCADGEVCAVGACTTACNDCGDCQSSAVCAAGFCRERISPSCSSDDDCTSPGACEALPGSCCGGECTYATDLCGQSCAPSICAAAGADCGVIADDCSGTVNCGDCTPPAICGAAGTNLCGECVAEINDAFCLRLGKDCEIVTADDNCGELRSVNCGTCPGSCVDNVCDCTAETDVAFCARLGKDCNTVNTDDNCGDPRSADCGSCTVPQCCGCDPGGTGVANVCGNGSCTPDCTAKACLEDDDCGSPCAVDDCLSGQARCAGALIEQCTHNGTCYAWGPATTCGPSATCFGDACCTLNCASAICGESDTCGGTCTAGSGCCDHECDPGEEECTGGAERSCGSHDGDPCRDWSADNNCTYGCGLNVCAAQCPTVPTDSSSGYSGGTNGSCNQGGALDVGGTQAEMFGADNGTTSIDGRAVTSCIVLDLGVVCNPSQVCFDVSSGVDICSGDQCGGVCGDCAGADDVSYLIFSAIIDNVFAYNYELEGAGNLAPSSVCHSLTNLPTQYLLICRGACAMDEFNLYIDGVTITP